MKNVLIAIVKVEDDIVKAQLTIVENGTIENTEEIEYTKNKSIDDILIDYIDITKDHSAHLTFIGGRPNRKKK